MGWIMLKRKSEEEKLNWPRRASTKCIILTCLKPLHPNAQCKKWRTKSDEQNGFKLKNGPFAGWMFALQLIMSGPNADGRREEEIDEFC